MIRDHGRRQLSRIEFATLRFSLRFEAGFWLSWEAFSSLRRRFRELMSCLDPACARLLDEHLFPPPFTDPEMARRHRRPAPALVLRTAPSDLRLYREKETLVLEVVFLGRGIAAITPFCRLLSELGRRGISDGRGRFELEGAVGLDPSGQEQPVSVFELEQPPVPLNDALWYLEGLPDPAFGLKLCFETPARLMQGGKPLFRPDFAGIFPFILRRVTSMIQAHCDIDLIEKPVRLMESASEIRQSRNNLKWEDWRRLQRPGAAMEMGGLCGSLHLEGEALAQLMPVLALGQLLQVGKGAAFGAGRLKLGDWRVVRDRAAALRV